MPGFLFDAVLGAGSSTRVLGVTFTYLFIDSAGNFTDVDGDGRYDTALKEIWYNDNFTWSTTGSGGFDIQTVALHENGHALELGHFGKIFRTKNGKLHFAPKALMNASYSGVQRSLRGTDNAAYCGNFASWPH